MRLEHVLQLVRKEATRAFEHHRAFTSPHEAYAVILEELDELWDTIRKTKSFKERNADMLREAIQVSAMAVRFVTDLIEE